MSAQGLEAIDHTVQLTHAWIHEVAARLGWDDRRRAFLLLRAVLTGLRDHLAHDEAAHLGAQMPVLLRGFYYEGWRPSSTPSKDRSADGFVEAVSAKVAGGVDEDAIAEALAVLARRVSAGEIADVKASLPAEIRALWKE